jgi:hypothetical protein
MNKKLKFGIGVVIGLTVTALLLWKFGPSWGLAMGLLTAGLGCLVIYGQSRDKIVSCFLASCMFVSPNLFAEDYYAGYNGQQCYCFSPAGEEPNPPAQEVFTLDFIMETTDTGEVQPRILSMAHPNPDTLMDYTTFNASLAAWGINLDGGEQYSKNGQPATVSEMPFAFGDWSNPLAIYPERPQYRVVVEVATELGEFTMWQPLTHFSVPEGVRIQFQDSPEGAQTFYRIRLEGAPGEFQPAGPILLGCGAGLLLGFGVVAVLTVRACARNKKKFQQQLNPTNAPPNQAQSPN